jgi:hypothetical protein
MIGAKVTDAASETLGAIRGLRLRGPLVRARSRHATGITGRGS